VIVIQIIPLQKGFTTPISLALFTGRGIDSIYQQTIKRWGEQFPHTKIFQETNMGYSGKRKDIILGMLSFILSQGI